MEVQLNSEATCEAGKRRSVNHTRAHSLASPGRAEAGAGAVGVGEARRGAVRRGRTGGAVRVRGRM